MTPVLQCIDLDLTTKLRDPDYRQAFFAAEASANIAAQLIELRKRRDFDQAELAELVGTKQPGISRIEKADYQNWSYNTLRRIAAALDARVRVLIEASEDVLKEYQNETREEPQPVAATPFVSEVTDHGIAACLVNPNASVGLTVCVDPSVTFAANTPLAQSNLGMTNYNLVASYFDPFNPEQALRKKAEERAIRAEKELAAAEQQNRELRMALLGASHKLRINKRP